MGPTSGAVKPPGPFFILCQLLGLTAHFENPCYRQSSRSCQLCHHFVLQTSAFTCSAKSFIQLIIQFLNSNGAQIASLEIQKNKLNKKPTYMNAIDIISKLQRAFTSPHRTTLDVQDVFQLVSFYPHQVCGQIKLIWPLKYHSRKLVIKERQDGVCV